MQTISISFQSNPEIALLHENIKHFFFYMASTFKAIHIQKKLKTQTIIYPFLHKHMSANYTGKIQ